MNRKQKGFTLIELLIVVAIIGILAAIAIPNLLTAMQRARQKRTLADMRTIATAWEARASDTGGYAAAGMVQPDTEEPQPGDSIEGENQALISTQLVSWLEPTYCKKIPVYDGWGQEFQVGAVNNEYAIVSSGANKSMEPETWVV